MADDVLRPVPALRRDAGPPDAARRLARRGAGPAGQAVGRAVRGRRPGVHLRAPYDAPGRGPLGDEGAPPLAGTGRRAGPRQLLFTERLLADPPRTRAWLRQFLQDCDEAFFAEAWSRLRHQLAADARLKTDLLRRKGLGEALTSVSSAVTLDEAAGRITVDKLGDGRTATGDGGLLLIPTSLGRPHLQVLHRHGWQPVLHYPAGSPTWQPRRRSSSSPCG